jgi:DHA1 family multidrug resistance protein-like MFS transporter
MQQVGGRDIKMSTQIRETQFGLLIRSLSSNKLFQYPDEVDPSIWMKSLQRNTTSISTPPGEHVGSSEKLRDRANSTNSIENVDRQTVDILHPSPGQAMQDGKDIYIVDWYGPDDPEVLSLMLRSEQLFLTQFGIESSELV